MGRTCRPAPIVAIAIAAFTFCAAAQQNGPRVGAAAPEFKLTDQFGHVQSLESLNGPNGMLLVFETSADW